MKNSRGHAPSKPGYGPTRGVDNPAPMQGAPGTKAHAGSQGVALWQQLTGVAAAFQAIRGGQSGTAALAGVDASVRPGVQALLFQVLRQAGRAEALRRQLERDNVAELLDELVDANGPLDEAEVERHLQAWR